MADFKFLQNQLNGKWVVLAPGRSHRTNVETEANVCPFCPGTEAGEDELYRVDKSEYQNPKSETNTKNQNTKSFEISNLENSDNVPNFDIRASDLDQSSDWLIRVIKNKFPFAPHHEVIIHSQDHHKSFDELPFSQVELILKTYRERFNTHKKSGDVYIFHNAGYQAGASLSHPHTQLVVIPKKVEFEISPLDLGIYKNTSRMFGLKKGKIKDSLLETEHFFVFCPETSEWPDEVWIAPKREGQVFGTISDTWIVDMAFVLSRVIQIFDTRHGSEFPFNFYFYPGKNWYLRLIPRVKIPGGFELGTNINVNTQEPTETFKFIQEHFWNPDHEKIRSTHQAMYRKRA